jgi:hypothetical protein
MQLAERWPQIVEQAAKAFGSIGNMTVLDGAEGVGKTLGEIIGAGAAGLGLLRNTIAGVKSTTQTNGTPAVPAAVDELIKPKV